MTDAEMEVDQNDDRKRKREDDLDHNQQKRTCLRSCDQEDYNILSIVDHE